MLSYILALLVNRGGGTDRAIELHVQWKAEYYITNTPPWRVDGGRQVWGGLLHALLQPDAAQPPHDYWVGTPLPGPPLQHLHRCSCPAAHWCCQGVPCQQVQGPYKVSYLFPSLVNLVCTFCYYYVMKDLCICPLLGFVCLALFHIQEEAVGTPYYGVLVLGKIYSLKWVSVKSLEFSNLNFFLLLFLKLKIFR